MTDVIAQPSLRERKKARTRASLREHALRLFREQGYAATTVEQIAAAAEVSPSTFFRYFPTKEDVVLQDAMDTRMADALLHQPPGLAPVAAMRAAVRETWSTFTAEEWEQFRQASELTASFPEIRARAIYEFTRTIDVLAEALAQRSGRQAGDLAVRVLAGAVIGVIMSVTMPAHADPEAAGAHKIDAGPESFALIDDALALLEAGLPLLSGAISQAPGPRAGRPLGVAPPSPRSVRGRQLSLARREEMGMLKIQILLGWGKPSGAGVLQSGISPRWEAPMPAVTVENPLVLPRVTEPAREAERPVIKITTAPAGLEGEGFPVRRAFAGVDLALLDPFIHMDQMGEVEYAAGEPKGTPWHPHRGFETVTYMIDGVFRHQDSNGGGGLITNGDTQWMTAGGGILHIEEPPEDLVASGGLFHGFQLWVNLPRTLKMTRPRYQDIRAKSVALLTSADGGALLRVIAGSVDGHDGPGVTHTPITLVHATVSPGAQVRLPWRPDFNALGYVLAGSGTVGPDARPVRVGQLALFGPGGSLTIAGDRVMEGPAKSLDIVLLGGEPIREPVATYGPFVMNTREELAQAFEDFQKGRLGTVPAGG